jgi:glucan phosphoethanolaminetransferase (alkaline phosphatase superfamily)
MEENLTRKPSGTAIQLGLLFGVIMVLEFVVSYVFNIDPILNPGIGTAMNTFNYLILPVLFIVLGCNAVKKAQGGFISFGECLKTGVLLCLIASLIYALFAVVFGMIFPEYMTEILHKTQQVMLKENPEMTREQMEMSLSMVKKFMNPVFMIPMTIVMFCLLGLIYSLIIGAAVKKDKPQFI